MSNGIQIIDLGGSANPAANCTRATLPIIGEFSNTFTGPTAPGAGNASSASVMLVELKPGSPAYNGAVIRNESCKPMRFVFIVLYGEDCDDTCTPKDQLTYEKVIVYVAPKSGKTIDIGFWQAAYVEVLNVHGANGTATQITEVGLSATVTLDTFWRPACPDCVKYAI